MSGELVEADTIRGMGSEPTRGLFSMDGAFALNRRMKLSGAVLALAVCSSGRLRERSGPAARAGSCSRASSRAIRRLRT